MMLWNNSEDRDEHPAWCFCAECCGDTELGATVEQTVSFIKKTVCNITRTVLQANREYNHYEREYNDMAFEINSGTKPATGDRKRQKGLPFLDSGKDLGADKRRIKILWAGDPKEANVHASWATVTLKLQSIGSGAKRLWTLGGSNPSLDVLINALGSDAHSWVGHELFMWCDKNNPSETPFVRVEVAETDASVKTEAAAPAHIIDHVVSEEIPNVRNPRDAE